MSATGPSAALAAIPRTPKALACMPQQPILPTDPPSLAIAQFPSSAHPSSKSAITVTPLPMSSNSSHPTSLQPLHHGLSLPSATTLSPEEVAMVQEHRRRQTTSALVEHPAHDHESYVYHQPSTPLPKSLRSATPSTSSCPIPSPPQARSTLYAGSIPALNVAPVSLLSPATARPQSFDMTASVDDTPVEAPPLSGAQPAARQPTTTEGGDWAFYEGMHQVESSIHLYA
ncbi:hypothetical protein PAXINDRAFT_103569 [Paxillus involutus ATCC 200175]|uniref:Uncharacterized protein n=1 Tax=Paxillus involutus ATCC 200175 TaxID=664439 RepID=A0A0C9TCL8_PAXIN|nr:hypothetical protein PAXINDRAFT_103569 [Paxillus involutus ATCC 200175]